MSANPPEEKLINGPVKTVDPTAKKVRVGWLLGLFSTTLEVTEDTRIAVEGTKGSLQDIQEGDLVKAAYLEQDGKNIAKSIEVTQAEAPKGVDAPGRAPGSPGSPTGSLPGSGEPAPGGTKTP
jgi:Cu/Ag efflux protein CusF